MAKMRSCNLIVTFIFGVSVVSADIKNKITYGSKYPTNASEVVCDHDSIIKAVNVFSSKIANEMETGDNIFYSPFSIYGVLSMVELGAAGKTKAEMQKVLEYQDTFLQESDLYNGFYRMISKLNERHGEYDLLAANGVFINKNYPVIAGYVKALIENYDANAMNVNFDSNEGIEIINSWVFARTHSMIPNVFSILDPHTRLVLLNAVYFKGTWETQFSKSDTDKDIFHNGEKEKYVSMMSMKNQNFLYWHDPVVNTQFLKMPYRGKDIVMLFALPDKYDAPASLTMNHELLCRVNSNLKKTQLPTIRIPKFKFNHTKEMKDILINLGMRDLFNAAASNLTGITKEQGIYVSSVLHKAVIEVDENGSEAAAVTSVVWDAIDENPDYLPSFIANHPFSFYIIYERNGMILFAGKVSDP